MSNEDSREAQQIRRLVALTRWTALGQALVFALLIGVGIRQQSQAKLQEEERELSRLFRSTHRDVLGAAELRAARYAGVTVEIEWAVGDETRRATVELETGEPVSSWTQKLETAARGLEGLK